jgi:hypothetical protein
MKKLVLAAFATVLLPTLVFAQGQVAFVSVPTGDPQGPYQRIWLASTLAPAPGTTTASLYWSATQNGTYTQIGGPVNVSTSSGRITAGVNATTGAATVGGTPAWFYVYGENAGLNVNGRAINFSSPTSDPAAQPTPTPPYLTGWDSTVGQVLMTPVPEPSSIALAGLGMGALLLFRRRK